MNPASNATVTQERSSDDGGSYDGKKTSQGSNLHLRSEFNPPCSLTPPARARLFGLDLSSDTVDFLVQNLGRLLGHNSVANPTDHFCGS